MTLNSTATVPEAISVACSTERGESKQRYSRIFAAALSALFGRGTSFLVNAITVPLTVRYLGAERYGLWVTISTTVMMCFVLDIGVANTLTNLISEAYAKEDRDRAAEYFATAFWIVLAIVVLLGIGGLVVWPYIEWGTLFHIQNRTLIHETSRAVTAAFIAFLCTLPTALPAKALAGYQELHAANLFAAGGSVLSLFAILTVVLAHGSLPMLVAAYAGSTVVANTICLFWLCFLHKPWLKPSPKRIDPKVVGKIFRSGNMFFLIQLAGLVVFNSDNLVISHFLNPARVTPYSVTWKFVSYITAIPILIYPALWPAYSEAYTRGDIGWIRSTYRRVRLVTIGVLVLACILLPLVGQTLIRLWAGSAAVPDSTLLKLMCVWMVIYAVTCHQSCLMGATGRVKRQALSSCAGALVNLALSMLWIRTMGVVGVLLATIFSYMIFIVLTQTWEVRGILRGRFALSG